MRYFLILLALLAATPAQARPEPMRMPPEGTVSVPTDELVRPKTPQDIAADAKQRAEEKMLYSNRAAQKNLSAKMPEANHYAVPNDPYTAPDQKPKNNPAVQHNNKPNPPHHQPDRIPEKPSGVSVRVNLSSAAPVTQRVVTTQPVTVVRPIVYENNIYSNNSYTCRSVNNLKYCTDYQGSALNGRIVQNYGDSVAYEHFLNGYQSGETTVFAADGLLLRKTNYKKSLKHGKETVYHPNGKVEYTANYKKGALDGTVLQYNMKGKQIGRMTYHDGRLQYRSCRYETRDPELLMQIKRKNYNELILCADDTRY